MQQRQYCGLFWAVDCEETHIFADEYANKPGLSPSTITTSINAGHFVRLAFSSRRYNIRCREITKRKVANVKMRTIRNCKTVRRNGRDSRRIKLKYATPFEADKIQSQLAGDSLE
jgi:hypothetical protein